MWLVINNTYLPSISSQKKKKKAPSVENWKKRGISFRFQDTAKMKMSLIASKMLARPSPSLLFPWATFSASAPALPHAE